MVNNNALFKAYIQLDLLHEMCNLKFNLKQPYSARFPMNILEVGYRLRRKVIHLCLPSRTASYRHQPLQRLLPTAVILHLLLRSDFGKQNFQYGNRILDARKWPISLWTCSSVEYDKIIIWYMYTNSEK